MLLDRFVLQRPLRTTGLSPLWLARDLRLETDVLIQVFRRDSLLEPGARERITREARKYRQFRDQHVARIHDLHEGEDLLLVSMDMQEGELLSAVLKRSGPMPYRTVLHSIRPLVEALAAMHASGEEHGCVDPDHVLVDGQSRWILLPGGELAPLRSDPEQLGQLMTGLLTGGGELREGKQLNDAAEHLYEGRTVPALLNQLVGDLHVRDEAQRPAGMQDVLNRLDQLQRYLEPMPAPAPASEALDTPPASSASSAPPPSPAPPSPAPPSPPPAPAGRAQVRAAPTGRRWPALRSRLPWLAVPALCVGGVLLFQLPDKHTTAVTVSDEIDEPVPPVASTPTPTESERDEAKVAQEKQRAEESLDRYLLVRSQVDSLEAAAWGGAPYNSAASAASAADEAFLSQDYATAAARYDEAATAFQRVFDTQGEAFERLLQAGRDALQNSDAQAATTAFQSALLIEPGNQEARIGLRRAATVEQLGALLSSGREHEARGEISFAHADFAAAVELDPYSTEAASLYGAIRTLLAEQQFQAMMTRALDAYREGRYDEARSHLAEAEQFRPGAPEVASALELVEEGELQAVISQLHQEAREHEAQEQWQAAWNDYRQVLAIDPAIQFAQEGKLRSEAMILLEKRTSQYLGNPDLLIQVGSREEAKAFVQQLQGTANLGPKLSEAAAQLAALVRLANTPLRVSLQSDEKTEVAVYRVGRYGAFKNLDLDLLPGVYTVIGQRDGYKDVRLTLRLEPGAQGTAMRVVCSERI